MMRFRYQLLGNLFFGVLANLLFGYAISLSGGNMIARVQPFTTQSDMLIVTVLFHKDAAPEVLNISPLNEGRITATQPGPYSISLLNGKDKSLFRLPFQVVFLKPGEPPTLADQIRLTFVVPTLSDAVKLIVDGPTGSVQAELPH